MKSLASDNLASIISGDNWRIAATFPLSFTTSGTASNSITASPDARLASQDCVGPLRSLRVDFAGIDPDPAGVALARAAIMRHGDAGAQGRIEQAIAKHNAAILLPFTTREAFLAMA